MTSTFFDELSSTLETLVVHGCPVVVGGDLNVHVEDPSDANAARLSYGHEAARDAAHTPGRRHDRPHRHVL